MRVSDLLAEGKRAAVPGRDLVRLLGLHDLREVTKLIERERRAGSPICASVFEPRGYYIASNAEELRAYISSIQRREAEVSRTRAALCDILQAWEGDR